MVDDKRAATPALGWGKKDDESLAAMPVPSELPAADAPEEAGKPPVAAKVVRRPPPIIAADPVPAEALPEAPAEPALPAPPAVAPSADEEITDTSNMRKFLLKQMVRAAKGEITTETVKSIVALSQQVYNATSLELKAAVILKAGDKSIRALELVSPQDADQ
ncbi:hypothetical protein PQR39_26120 [Paraburkholderia sediminicola]|uniref:hypothetical protein n=1 Tax=Paraburkholderia sediminicola TaxID=458836 RepID=UPI0038B965F1